jgi:hypothetical protein
MKYREVWRQERDGHHDVEINRPEAGRTMEREPFILVPARGYADKTIRVTIEEAVDEQARKGLLAYGGAEARRIHDAAFPHAPLEPGRNIRITMEEEVSACCEKWRTARILNVEFCSLGGKRDSALFVRCPECGEPLRETA